MDIDNIKKTWLQADISPNIGEEKIQQMINNKGKSAFESLLMFEKIGLVVLFLLIPLTFLIFDHIILKIYYFTAIFFSILWQAYKIYYLKRKDILTKDIAIVAKYFLLYKSYIIKEFFVGMLFFITFIAIFGYLNFLEHSMHNDFLTQIFLFIIAMSIGLVIALALYRFVYWNNIKIIEKSIKEIKEFEKED